VLLASRGKTYTSPAFAASADGRDFEDLSPKQLAALRLLAQGLERKQIAERMQIGEETVKTHLSEVRRKLGARTSAQAVAIGLINSLFDYPDQVA
jgi:DNA-binding NarL/FixJ family response regulator